MVTGAGSRGTGEMLMGTEVRFGTDDKKFLRWIEVMVAQQFTCT